MNSEIAMGALLESRNVEPSLGASAGSAAPIVPPAPPLLSTTTVCPGFCCNGTEINRAMTSLDPPGAKVTITRTGLLGQACARTMTGTSKAAAPKDFTADIAEPINSPFNIN